MTSSALCNSLQLYATTTFRLVCL